jgi:thiol-disulfide isomerase/thioredoxin
VTPLGRRRAAFLIAVGGGALATGLIGRLLHERRLAQTEAADAAALAEHGGLWGLSFQQPSGGELAMAAFRGRPLVLNFWATWCPPCVKEFPELDRFHREFAGRGWQVVGLAIDGPTPVREFLQRVPVGFAIGLAGFGGTELGRALGNERGGLPFTVMFDARGAVRQRKLGETTFDELASWARELG